MPVLPIHGGRAVEYQASGPIEPGAPVLVFHHGQPGAALIDSAVAGAAARHGLQVVMVSRPGYSRSARQPGRRVAAAALDVEAVLDHLGAGSFVSAGWSGGGPHALACGALLAPRCRAVATIAGVAPFHGVEDLEWTAGMGPENVAEFSAIVAGDPGIEGQIAALCATLAGIADVELADALGGLISPPDRAALESGMAPYLAESMRMSASAGHFGYWDDGLAFVAPWGFDPAAVPVPVQVWMAGADLMVPASHGRWLAAHIPTATAEVREDDGHISLWSRWIDQVVDGLAAAGGLAGER